MTRKNTHMTHIDEALFEGGADVTNQIRRILTQGTYDLTVKWDGSPAIFVGRDPADGEFFIATKSLFNKSPKLYKNTVDILDNEPSGKATKLCEAFDGLCQLDIPIGTVLQGDLIFTNEDIKIKNGYVSVHPNTLIYSWDILSDEALDVMQSDVGVVFHTTYTGGNNLQEYTANFGFDINSINVPSNLWIRSADIDFKFYDLPRIPVMSEAAEKILEIMTILPQSRIGAHIKSFYNSRIREQYTAKPNLSDYLGFVQRYYEMNVFSKLKTDTAKQRAAAEMEVLLDSIMLNDEAFYEAFDYVEQMQMVKNELLAHLNANQSVHVEIDGKLMATGHEGYVLIDKLTGDAFKLVNRANFSYFNFSDNVKKGWQKDVH